MIHSKFKFMIKKLLNLDQYNQTKKSTCLASCALMILHYFSPKDWELDVRNEILIHENIRYSKDLDFGCYSKLAYFLCLHDFDVYVVLGEFVDDNSDETRIWKEYFEKTRDCANYVFLGDSDLKEKMKKVIIEGLFQGLPLIIYLHSEFHNVVVYGIEDDIVYYIDPIKGKKYISLNNLFLKALNPWGIGLMYFRPKLSDMN